MRIGVVGFLIGLVVGAAAAGRWGYVLIQEKEQALASANSDLAVARDEASGLDIENDRLAAQLEELLAEVRALEKRLAESYEPVEVGGRADLPVQRAFARPGDTLERFVAREKTSVAVVRALNPWLPNGNPPLDDRQALWIPKPPETQ